MKRKTMVAALIAAMLGTVAVADGAKIMVQDAYARSSNPKVAAAFMGLKNHGAEDDRLIAATSPAAKRVELHTHQSSGDGVMKMVKIEGGIEIEGGGAAMLKRGGDHVMLMGLVEPLKQGDRIEVTLTFEKAGDVTLEIPIDNERKPEAGAHGGHGGHSSRGTGG